LTQLGLEDRLQPSGLDPVAADARLRVPTHMGEQAAPAAVGGAAEGKPRRWAAVVDTVCSWVLAALRDARADFRNGPYPARTSWARFTKAGSTRTPKPGPVGQRTTPLAHRSDEVGQSTGRSVLPLNSMNGPMLGVKEAKWMTSR